MPAYAYEPVYRRGGEPRDPLYKGTMYLKGYFEVKGEWAVISIDVTVYQAKKTAASSAL